MAEFEDYWDILLGREEPPVDYGVTTLMECANVFYARGKEVEKILLQLEREGDILKGSSHYKYRTGELRAFCEMAKAAQELGVRRHVAARDEIEDLW